MCITCMSVDRQKHEWRISGQSQERTLQVRQTDRVQKIVSESSPAWSDHQSALSGTGSVLRSSLSRVPVAWHSRLLKTHPSVQLNVITRNKPTRHGQGRGWGDTEYRSSSAQLQLSDQWHAFLFFSTLLWSLPPFYYSACRCWCWSSSKEWFWSVSGTGYSVWTACNYR